MMSAFENGAIPIHKHVDEKGNRVHIIPEVAAAYVYIPEAGYPTVTLDSFEIIDESCHGQIESTLLEVAADTASREQATSLDALINLETARHFLRIFSEEKVKVERYNAEIMAFEPIDLSLGGLIVFLQTSPLRYLPDYQHAFRLTAQVAPSNSRP